MSSIYIILYVSDQKVCRYIYFIMFTEQIKKKGKNKNKFMNLIQTSKFKFSFRGLPGLLTKCCSKVIHCTQSWKTNVIIEMHWYFLIANWPQIYNWNIVESGIKYHKPKKEQRSFMFDNTFLILFKLLLITCGCESSAPFL
jgi:hypothetical protein